VNEDTTLSRPLPRRDILIAVALLCVAVALVLWRSDFGQFPDTVGPADQPSKTRPPGSTGTER
jgi:hypothetical protein